MLKRTLRSLSQTIWSDNIKEIWVIENGPVCGVESICEKFSHSRPIFYLHEQKLGLSAARNAGINASTCDMVVLFDDDMKFNQDTLTAYENAIQTYGLNYFYGGALIADYEKEPPVWLINHLPPSAKGFSLGDKTIIIETSNFLGGNHAIPKWIFSKLGGYDSCCATGEQGGVGEENRLQNKLLEMGLKGVYVPDAVVHHFVPLDRCTKKWILNREVRHGITDADTIKIDSEFGRNIFGIPFWYLKEVIRSIFQLIVKWLVSKNKSERFFVKRKFARIAGSINALIQKRKN